MIGLSCSCFPTDLQIHSIRGAWPCLQPGLMAYMLFLQPTPTARHKGHMQFRTACHVTCMPSRVCLLSLRLQTRVLVIQMSIAEGAELESLAMQVTIGQKSGQAQRSASRCIWDVKTDGAASECYENESMFCVCQVWPATAVLTVMHALHTGSSCPGNALAQCSGQSPSPGARALGKNESGMQ